MDAATAFPAIRDLPAGAPVSDHVHNRHGANFGCTICWPGDRPAVPDRRTADDVLRSLRENSDQVTVRLIAILLTRIGGPVTLTDRELHEARYTSVHAVPGTGELFLEVRSVPLERSDGANHAKARDGAVDGFALTVPLLTGQAIRAAWKLWEAGRVFGQEEHPVMSETLRDQIRAIGDPLIAAGKNDMEVRTAIIDQLGIGIGGGGGGTTSDSATRCGYCGQNGNGGHGGFCPNGSNW